MFCKRFRFVAGAVVALAVLVGAMDGTAFAEPPEPVVRTFGFLVANTTDPDAVPNFLGEDSVAVTRLPHVLQTNPFTVKFVGSESNIHCLPENYDERLDGTTWVAHPANHTTKGPKEADRPYVWLHDDGTSDPPLLGAQADPPPIGAHTFTGPNGWVIDQKVYQIMACTAYCCGSTAASLGYYRVVEPPYSGKFFVVVTAWFSQ